MHFATSSPHAGTTVIAFPAHAIGGDQGVALTAIITAEIQAGAVLVVLDLSLVETMNSTGLGMLVSSLATTSRTRTKLCLAAVPERVQNLLEITHLVKVFTVVGSVHDAIAP